MRHPAADLPLDRRVEYLQAVSALAFVDLNVDDRETKAIAELAQALELTEQVEPPSAYQLTQILDRVRTDEKLCVELLRDAIVVAFADGKVEPSESHLLAEMSRRLGLTLSDVALIARSVQEELAKDLADGLADERGAFARFFKRITQRLKI
jgi:tellurite resistance protein